MVTLSGESLAVPRVSQAVSLVGSAVQIQWPVSAFSLQSTPSLNPANWQPFSQTPTVANGTNTVTISSPTGSQFFRLVH
jgi:hypothetical protein